MMSDKDVKDYHKLVDKLEKTAKVKGLKKSNKYNYISGKQLTDPGSGTRVYDIVGTRLPSVTTILGATKNQDFINFCKELSDINFTSKGNLDKLKESKMDNGNLVKDNLVNLIAKIGEKITIRRVNFFENTNGSNFFYGIRLLHY